MRISTSGQIRYHLACPFCLRFLALIRISCAGWALRRDFYGVLFRLEYHYLAFGLMSKAFLYGVPFVLGFVQVYVSEKYVRRGWRERLMMPWAPALLCLAVSLLLAWEGLI